MRAGINCALANRRILTHLTRRIFTHFAREARLDPLFDVSHNTCKEDTHELDGRRRWLFVHRKGATRDFPAGHPDLPSAFRATAASRAGSMQDQSPVRATYSEESQITDTGLAVFDKTVQETNIRLSAIMQRMRTNDRHLAYAALRATLHALRDRIGPQNAVHLGAQLPMLVRGLYYEGWHMGGTPTKERGCLRRFAKRKISALLFRSRSIWNH